MNAPAVAVSFAAHWLLGAAYIAWRSRRIAQDLSPMGLLRNLDRRAETNPEISVLPLPVIVALVAAVFVAALTFWPLLALRLLAINLGLVKVTRP